MLALRRALPLVLLAASGCYLEGPHSRDEHRTVDQIRQEHRWAADQIGRRTSAEELARIRAGDAQAARDGRRRFLRLIDALDRVTWMREATPRGLWASVEDAPDLDELAFRFERAGKLRRDAMAEADELAEALATTPLPGALTFADLRKALITLRNAEAAEGRIQADLEAVARKEKALRDVVRRFPTLPPQSPRPFVAAAAAYLRQHPNERAELDKLPKDLSEDVQRIRAAYDEEGPPPAAVAERAQRQVPQEPPPDEKAAVRDRAEREHAAADAEAARRSPAPAGRPGLVELQGDARAMLTARGLPRAISSRDGLLALRYEEQRPCGSGNCATLVDYLFNANGSLAREEVVGLAPPRAKRWDDRRDDDEEFKGDD